MRVAGASMSIAVTVTVATVACHRHPGRRSAPADRIGGAAPALAPRQIRVVDDSTGFPIEGASILWTYRPNSARAWESSPYGIAAIDTSGYGDVPAATGRVPVRITAGRYQWLDDTLDFSHLPTEIRLRRRSARPLIAREPSSCPPPPAPPEAIPFCALVSRPFVDMSSVPPRFDSIPVQHATPGRFAVSVVLDTAGRPIRERTRLMFGMRRDTAAIRDYIAGLRFTPARTAMGRVETSLMVEVLPETVGGDVPSTPFATQAAFSHGILITTGFRRIEPVQPAPAYSLETIRAIKRTILANVLPILEADSGRVTCLGDRASREYVSLDQALVAELPPDRYVPASRCPHTYAQMFAAIDTLGRPVRAPPGYHDPARLDFESVTAWTPTIARVRVRTAVGAHGRLLQCVVYFGDGFDRTRVTCGDASHWMS